MPTALLPRVPGQAEQPDPVLPRPYLPPAPGSSPGQGGRTSAPPRPAYRARRIRTARRTGTAR
ncbi:hypothetical protein GXW82_24470 [Streptacidiphilus sp. 4-A2]|nr:hypothetical protein [Streptacidiphilus sp. 4-A2]